MAFGTAQAADYKLDPTHTKAVFYIDHFNTSTNSGEFHNISGDMSYSPEKKNGDAYVPRFYVFEIEITAEDVLQSQSLRTLCLRFLEREPRLWLRLHP